MKVCFFIPSLGDGGAQRQCIALLNVLQRQPDLEIHLVLLGRGEHEAELDTAQLSIHRIDINNFADPRALIFILTVLVRVRADVLISWLRPADIWAYAASRLLPRVAWVMTERNSFYPDELIFNLRKSVGRRGPAAIVANSEGGRKLWQSLSPKPPIRVIPNMVIRPHATLPPREGTRDPDLLYVGRLEPQKNIALMLDIFAKFASISADGRLVIAGKGSLSSRVEPWAEQYGISQRVRLLGFRQDVQTLMAKARVFLSFSVHEGMPNTVMEAITAGVPAVVSDIPEHRALLGDDYPYFVDLNAPPAEAAETVMRAWAESKNSSRSTLRHANEVLATMTPEHIANSYIELFKEVIGTKRPRSNAQMKRPRQRP